MGSRNLQIPSPKKLKIDNNGDRISTLPNNLLHEILALLDMKQVVQTSVLSTRWRDLWTSISTLNFNSTVFLKSTKKTAKDKDRFIEFVDQALLHHDNSSLKTFRLFYDERRRLPPERVYSWIRALTLHLEWVDFVDVKLTSNLLSSCPDLESLIIVYCRFAEMKNLVIFNLKLKHLVIENCSDGEDECEKDYCKITIYAPNLVSLRLKDHLGRDYSIGTLSSLVTVDIHMEKEIMVDINCYTTLIPAKVKVEYAKRVMRHLKVVRNVRALTISPWMLEVLNPPVSLVEVRPLQFLNLRHLNLITWLSGDCIHAIAYLLNSSPNVESLNLKLTKRDVYVFDGDEEVFHPTIASKYQDTGLTLRCMYNLKYVEIQGILGCPNGLKFLEVLLKNALVLEKMVIFTFTEHLPNKEKWLMKFIEKLQKISRASSSTSIFVR
ncbi:hypothetical protein IFM89_008807 [Coptis chinensis]|uniref:F-box domain-containing protein n=1 Tax=Coptis chinensis TaxID=261450 RepID=A0A835GYB9_9MAGN|nr:hypothetical protein IFM89_008807 [Coptis chinensis]